MAMAREDVESSTSRDFFAYRLLLFITNSSGSRVDHSVAFENMLSLGWIMNVLLFIFRKILRTAPTLWRIRQTRANPDFFRAQQRQASGLKPAIITGNSDDVAAKTLPGM
ncbi:hypothetical protein [Geminicoccus flavidas]|uniref:hypothetical protein n=1 Tax=Geminicoccus flavidas TaxID=2506407 RepID=UPI00135A8356|nr:hypothetical protein [Geminicoccus flavidas]